jgi:hypothetical protein
MSKDKPEYGPHVGGTESQMPDRFHRRATDLPGYVAQRVDAIEAAVGVIAPARKPRLAGPGDGAHTAVSFVLVSGAASHETAVLSLMSALPQAATALGLAVKCLSVERRVTLPYQEEANEWPWEGRGAPKPSR